MRTYSVELEIGSARGHLFVRRAQGAGFVYVRGAPLGRAAVDDARGIVALAPDARARVAAMAIDPVALEAAAAEAVWIEARARDALATAVPLAAESPALAAERMREAAARAIDTPGLEGTRAAKLRARIEALALRFR